MAGLRIIGEDAGIVKSQGNPQFVSGTSDKSSQLIQQAGQTTQAGYAAMQNTLGNLVQSQAQINQNAQQSTSAIGAAAQAAAKYAGQGSQNMADSLGRVNQSLQGWQQMNQQREQAKAQAEAQRQQQMVDYQRFQLDVRKQEVSELQYKQEAEQKAAQANRTETQKYNAAAAHSYVFNNIIPNAPEIIQKHGTGYYQQQVQDALAKQELSPEDRTQLETAALQPMYAYQGKTRDIAQDENDKLHNMVADAAYNKFQISISGVLGKLAANTDANPNEVVGELQGMYQKFREENPNLSVLQLAQIDKMYTSEMSKRFQGRADVQSAINQHVQSIENFQSELAPYREQVRAGTMSREDYSTISKQLEIKNGLTSAETESYININRDQEEQLKLLQTQNGLQQAQQQGYLNDLNGVEVTNAWVAAKATTLVNDPAALASYENSPYARSPQAQKVIAVAKLKIRSNNELNALNLQINDARMAQTKFDIEYKKMLAPDSGASMNSVTALAEAWIAKEDPTIFQKLQAAKTGDDKKDLEAAGLVIRSSLQDRVMLLQQQSAQIRQQLSPYGMDGDDAKLKAFINKGKLETEQIDNTLRTLAANQGATRGGATPNFKIGNATISASAFKRAEHRGVPLMLPFKPNAQVTISDVHGKPGDPGFTRGRPHGGMDLAVPVGTPVLAQGNGVVTLVTNQGLGKGYGQYMDVKFEDGAIQRFAHLSKQLLKVGDRVNAGDAIALSGNTGDSSGPHLHWEFRKSSSGGMDQTIDPATMASLAMGSTTTKRPRGAGMRNDFNPYGGTKPSSSLPNSIPKDAVPLFGSLYIYKSQVYDSNAINETKEASQQYNRSNPIKNGYAENTKIGFNASRDNDGVQNFGYAALARDSTFTKKLHKVATSIGIPTSWLADIMAFETGGTFSPNKGNGLGYYGLIQFGEEAARGMGTSTGELSRMTGVQQLDYVEKYLKYYAARKPGDTSEYKSIEYVLAAIWAGPQLRDKMDKGKFSEALRTSDVNTDFRGYLEKLGSHRGVQYKTIANNKRAAVASPIHSSYQSGCTMCDQLHTSGSNIIPHEAQ